MKDSYKNAIVYAVIAVVVLLGVYIYASTLFSPTYSLSLKLSQESVHNATFQSPGSTVYPYQTSILGLVINNTGGSNIQNMTIILYINGQQLQTLTIRSLPAHTGSIKDLSYTYPESGSFAFSAVADPAHVFNIANRQNAQSNLTVNVTSAQQPDAFTSIPNNNINDAQDFALSSVGASSALYMYNNYTLGFSSGIFNGNTLPYLQLMKVSAPYLENFSGARAEYANGTGAYAAWMQSGVVTLPSVKGFFSALNYSVVNRTIADGNGLYMQWNRTTSLCFVYRGGWVKFVSFSNASTPSTCTSIENATYVDTESNALLREVAVDPKLMQYQNVSQTYSVNEPSLMYGGSQPQGRLVASENGLVTVVNFFSLSGNSTSGGALFAGLVSRNGPTVSTAPRLCADGITFTYNDVSICSQYTPQTTGWIGPSALMNSTYIGRNHTITLYSLVNASQVYIAHDSASSIIATLEPDENPYLMWESEFSNVCTFKAPRLGCSYVGIDSSAPSITVNVINNYASPIDVQKMSCFFGFPQNNYTVDNTIAPGAQLQVTVPCRIIPPGGFIPGFSFNMSMYYNLNGTNQSSQGRFNFTNSN